MPRVLVLVAGLPNGILGPLIGRLKKGNADLDVIQTLPLESAGYTAEYAENLYRMVCSTLREVVGSDRSDLWSVNFVVLYLSKKDGSDYYIVKRFDIEALLVPMVMKKPRAKAPKRHEAHIAINELVLQSNQMLRNARMILRSLAQEVTNRDTILTYSSDAEFIG